MPELKKTIGPWRGTAMMLNIVLGAGLLTLPGLAVQTAGSAALLVWLVCAVAALPLLVVFAILGRTYPDAGGLSAFMKRAFGEVGYVCATFLFLGAVAVGLPAIALTGGHYAAAVLGGSPAVYAALLVVAAMLANLASAETTCRLNAALASAILLVLAGIALAGWIAVRPETGTVPLLPEGLPDPKVFGAAFMMVFFAFTGWEVSANLGGEFTNPRRDFPLAMALSFVVAVGLYLALAYVAAGAGQAGMGAAPFAVIFEQRYGPLGGRIIGAVSVLLIFANLSAALWAVSRMVYSGAREGLLPARLSQLRDAVPVRAVGTTTATLLIVVGLAGSGVLGLDGLLAAAGQNFLLLYAGAAAALIRLSATRWHRTLGMVCVAMVLVLMQFRGLHGILYPGFLVLCGYLLVLRRQHASAYTALRQPPESA